MKRPIGYIALTKERALQISVNCVDERGQFFKVGDGDGDGGIVGIVPVFKTKTAARKVFGRKVELSELVQPSSMPHDSVALKMTLDATQ